MLHGGHSISHKLPMALQIIPKAVLGIIGRDVEDAAGPFQVCAGQEDALHAQ